MPTLTVHAWPLRVAVGGLLGLTTLLAYAAPADTTEQVVNAEQSPKPPAKQKREPLVIPKVDRDKVICFCLYTVHHKILKLSAQLYPLLEGEARTLSLEVEREGGWEKLQTKEIHPVGWMTTFRIENWDDTRSWNYRVSHPGGAKYTGIIRKNPLDKDVIVVGNLSCNSNTDRGPRTDIIANLKHQDPDLLFFAGDQSYDHKQHYAAWLLFGRQFGEIIKDRPTVTIPDDHDVGHPNLWGAAGKQSFRSDGADGGYFMPVEYVNEVQQAQTSHLPDPFDPTPVLRGISVYYTSLNVGGIDFAIIEDRKWKSGPLGIVPKMGPRPDHINDPKFDRQSINVPEAELLGERQLKFLRQWGQNWDGVTFKTVLSQSPFANAAHLHGAENNRLIADLDSNGWPQHGRDAALREFRRCFALHLCGDQHLATVIHHGVNDWEDAGISFASPSIWNLYGRWWHPLDPAFPGGYRNPALPFSGRYLDGLGNKITMMAYANPAPDNHKATGYGLVRFNKKSREITLECWPRFVDVTKPEAKQYTGWPLTVSQFDNYGRKPIATLPQIVSESPDPVVQIIDEQNGEIVYTVRIKGTTFTPKVFRAGSYTVRVDGRESKDVQSIPGE